MGQKGLALILMVVFISACLPSIVRVYADVPSVLELTVEEEGTDFFLTLEIRHGSPSTNHYVDVIEIEIDGKVEKVDDLEPQKSTIFTYKYNLGKTQPKKIKVRAHCNVHGWSQLKSEEKKDGGVIPGFPYESILIGIIISLIILWKLQRRE